MADSKITSRMSYLRKYLRTPMDAEIVKEMIQDGLDDTQIMEALGVPVKGTSIHPDGHPFSNAVPTDEEEKVAAQQQNANKDGPQPDEPGETTDESEGEAGDAQEDPLMHIAGLLTHLSGKNKKPK